MGPSFPSLNFGATARHASHVTLGESFRVRGPAKHLGRKPAPSPRNAHEGASRGARRREAPGDGSQAAAGGCPAGDPMFAPDAYASAQAQRHGCALIACELVRSRCAPISLTPQTPVLLSLCCSATAERLQQIHEHLVSDEARNMIIQVLKLPGV